MSNSNSVANKNRADLKAARIIAGLSILLAIQLALSVTLKVFESKYQPVEPTAPLLACDFSKVTKVVVEELQRDTKSKSQLVLQKGAQGWELPDYFGFPVLPANINELFATLKNLKRGFPVTTTSGAAERFKVSPDNYERAIYLYEGDRNVGTLFLGSSPSFQTFFAKVPANDEIYTAEIPQTELKVKPSDWIDKGTAELKVKEVTSVDMGTLKLKSANGQWTLERQGKSEPLHESVAQNCISDLSRVGIDSVLGTKPEADYNLEEPMLSYKLTLKNGNVLNYTFSKSKDKQHYVLKISDKIWYLEVPDWSINRIKSLTAEALLKSNAQEMARLTAAKQKSLQELAKPVKPGG